jgi:hypothetical protein
VKCHRPGRSSRLSSPGGGGDAEIEAHFTDGGDVTVFRHPLGAQHATEIGHGTDDESDAGAAATLQDADLHALDRLLRAGTNDGRSQRGKGGSGRKEEATHEENLRLEKDVMRAKQKTRRARALAVLCHNIDGRARFGPNAGNDKHNRKQKRGPLAWASFSNPCRYQP